MNLREQLSARSNNSCELCKGDENLSIYEVHPSQSTVNDSILICDTCFTQLEHSDQIDPNHWRCLNDSMWSEVPAVQVMAYRTLHHLKAEGWPQDLLDMLYLDEKTLQWAQTTETESEKTMVTHRDSNGVLLTSGDTVVVIKDLDVKGSSITAKRGTAVRNISLVLDNPEQIEGRVNGQLIVILTKFVKKQ